MPSDTESTAGDSSESTSTGLPGMECPAANETSATTFVRVQPADFDWAAPEGTPAFITFDCVPVAAGGGGVIDLICEDDTQKPTASVRFEIINNLPALDLSISSILDQPEVAMTFLAAPIASVGLSFSISSMAGEVLILGQNANGAPSSGTAVPSTGLGWDHEFIVRDPGCVARPSFRESRGQDRSLALEVPADDGVVVIFDTDLQTVTLDGTLFTILVPNAFTVVQTMCPVCQTSDFDVIVVPGVVELP